MKLCHTESFPSMSCRREASTSSAGDTPSSADATTGATASASASRSRSTHRPNGAAGQAASAGSVAEKPSVPAASATFHRLVVAASPRCIAQNRPSRNALT